MDLSTERPFIFTFQQISDPYNQQMKDSKRKLQYLFTNNSNFTKIVFNTIKVDILLLLRLVSKTLQENSLLLLQLITIFSTAIKTIKKIKKLIKTHEYPFAYHEFFSNFQQIH